MKGILAIEINFPELVELSDDDARQLEAITGMICDRYQAGHPGRVMWPFGMGYKITYMPMTRDEELAGKHMEFDEQTFAIDCSERADYAWECAKCGFEQGEHEDHIVDGKAGDCQFSPAVKEPAPIRERGLVPMYVYLSAVKGRQDMRQALREARAKIKELEAAIGGNT